ncbi:LicD family-domain-containing protein [Biscogniauxia sp. FL1348]|nr:LicD family-domain-containing protein [Biscogniauxia sp. FL1348]
MHLLAPFLLALVLSSTSTSATAALAVRPRERAGGVKGTGSRTKPHKPHETKYFHEPGGGNEMGHYDARYFRGKVPYEEHRPALQHLIRSYLTTFRELGIETWLAHGSLLGWWWNGRIMPWDYDLDVQVTVDTLRYLAQHLNRTTHEYTFLMPATPSASASPPSESPPPPSSSSSSSSPQEEEEHLVTKTYLLDVNPHHGDVGRGNGANVIDARWIDTSNGMFVDITGLAERDPDRAPGVWSCKNAHRYRTAELYPMRRTVFEGVPADVPYAFDRILVDEYGPRSLVATEWAGQGMKYEFSQDGADIYHCKTLNRHHWVPELLEWVKKPKPAPIVAEHNGKEAGSVGHDQEQKKIEVEHTDEGDVVVVVVEETVVEEVQAEKGVAV